MKAEPGYVICNSACALLDAFQRYLEIQLSSAYTYVQPLQRPPLLKRKMLYGDGFGGGGANSSKNVGLRVIEEKMKIFTYLYVGKNSYLQNII
jgi:hypothetical protein